MRGEQAPGGIKDFIRFFTPLNFPMGTLSNGVNAEHNAPCANRVYPVRKKVLPFMHEWKNQ